MGKTIWWLILFLGCSLFALILYYALSNTEPESETQPAAPAPVAPPTPTQPQIRYPVIQPPTEKLLPALDVSDASMRNALAELLTDKSLIGLFQVRDFVRRVVATIDNLPRSKISLRLSPARSVGGKFLVAGKDDGLAIKMDNAARYAMYVRLAGAIDAASLVALYIHFYPLFQQAYQELGYPKGYFNDRLVEVIDHLLATPEVKAPVKLMRPHILYLYSDPELEARSAGQKILVRVGSDNAAAIKAKLREIRGELLRQIPKR